jgi:predicted metal-binding protein
MMQTNNLHQYCQKAIEYGATDAKLVHPGTVVTAAWVKWKCQYGCIGYGKRYTCPPESPTWKETRELLDSYHHAILFHSEMPDSPDRGKRQKEYMDKLIELEGELFKDGYYRAFVLLAGPCRLCKECAKAKGLSCNFGAKARPCMEACGIDVFQTARNNGFHIVPLSERSDTRNFFCLMLVD